MPSVPHRNCGLWELENIRATLYCLPGLLNKKKSRKRLHSCSENMSAAILHSYTSQLYLAPGKWHATLHHSGPWELNCQSTQESYCQTFTWVFLFTCTYSGTLHDGHWEAISSNISPPTVIYVLWQHVDCCSRQTLNMEIGPAAWLVYHNERQLNWGKNPYCMKCNHF